MTANESSTDRDARVFLAKAEQNLAAAVADDDAGRCDACAGRAYYACFQAAVAALLRESIRPRGASGQWSHEFVQAQFAGVLIARRKRFSAELRRTLPDLRDVREQADYRPEPVAEPVAGRALRRARSFVTAVKDRWP